MATSPTGPLVWQKYLRLLGKIEDEKKMIKKPFLVILTQPPRVCGPLILHAKVCRDHFLGDKLPVSSLHDKAMHVYILTPIYPFIPKHHQLFFCDQNVGPMV